jgi:hypothetical protein
MTTVMPQGIKRSRQKGARLPANTICVSRPSRWGNPHQTGNPSQDCVAFSRDLARMSESEYQAYLAPLRGMNLACWCPLDEPCHRDILLHAVQECFGKEALT